jgi:hypothetical protein
MPRSPVKELSMPPKLKLDRNFQPCPLDDGEEAYPNGIFEFNIILRRAGLFGHPCPRPATVNQMRDSGSPPGLRPLPPHRFAILLR